MGYSTDFSGQFNITPPLKEEHKEYLFAFAETRRMKRDADKASILPDLIRDAAGLPIGDEGGYFVGADGLNYQSENESVLDRNKPPINQPGLWCDWVPNEDGTAIEWDGGEKFYDYIKWIEYLITHFLSPWGYKVNGLVEWFGEDRDDTGEIEIKDNVVSSKSNELLWEED